MLTGAKAETVREQPLLDPEVEMFGMLVHWLTNCLYIQNELKFVDFKENVKW